MYLIGKIDPWIKTVTTKYQISSFWRAALNRLIMYQIAIGANRLIRLTEMKLENSLSVPPERFNLNIILLERKYEITTPIPNARVFVK